MANSYCQATLEPLIPADLMTQDIRQLLAAFGFSFAEADQGVYCYADEYSSLGYNETTGDYDIDIQPILQNLIAHSGNRLKYIAIEGAFTCSKMRPGEFGGFAIFVTERAAHYANTTQWIGDCKQSLTDTHPSQRPVQPGAQPQG